MPGEQKPEKEKLIHEPELQTMDDAGLVLPLQTFKLIIEGRDGEKTEDAYDLIYLRGHGIGLYSRRSTKTYIVTLYGLSCLAKGLGIHKGDIILTGSEVSRG
jgi:hypothetical protein